MNLKAFFIFLNIIPTIAEAQPARQDDSSSVSIVILGTIQDAGSPHMGCTKKCCEALFETPDPLRRVVSLGLIDAKSHQYYMFEASPHFHLQTKHLQRMAGFDHLETPDGIFLTHAHIGHYTGLMYLGREAMNANRVPVYAMPKMKAFLESNGPWSQLAELDNIDILELKNESPLKLNTRISIKPFLVPHRDEYSETVGYRIDGPDKSAIFIPDIDKWSKWGVSILELIREVDLAFLDGTFFDAQEVNNRDLSEIPHPFITESMASFSELSVADRKKIHFIHFNHTNPVLSDSSVRKSIQDAGYGIAETGDRFDL